MRPFLRDCATTLVLASIGIQGAWTATLDCTYAARGGELEPHAACAASAPDGAGPPHLSAATLRRLGFDAHGLAWLAIGGTFYYARRDGRLLAVIPYDNGPDDFAEGLVRSLVDGRIAYYDRRFRQVIPPTYDWGWPFEGGRARVCSGCKAGPADDDGHRAMVGGVFGSIDRTGKVVEALK